jgi:predicted small lipoprotein YifL
MKTVQRIIAMLKALKQFVLALLASAVVAGCGQKGPLYLPGDPSAIYSAPPQQNTQPAEDVDEDEDEDENGETPVNIQN